VCAINFFAWQTKFGEIDSVSTKGSISPTLFARIFRTNEAKRN
jgi:hypothetical protein